MDSSPKRCVAPLTALIRAAQTKTPAGLQNLGNTCYMNSVIQVMRTVPELQTALNRCVRSLLASNATQLRRRGWTFSTDCRRSHCRTTRPLSRSRQDDRRISAVRVLATATSARSSIPRDERRSSRSARRRRSLDSDPSSAQILAQQYRFRQQVHDRQASSRVS